jgi:predicted component of type VI protein secretion system
MTHVFLDLPSGHVSLDAEEVVLLREAADSAAGRSSIARDLSAILDSATHSSRPRVLRRAEVRALIGLAREAGLPDVEAKLTANDRAPTEP